MSRMGMDVEAVEDASRNLRRHAQRLDDLIGLLDKTVRALPGVWNGRDADRFVNDWWPEHRATMQNIKKDVDGLGQSAWNNAQEQRGVSGEAVAGSGQTGTGPAVMPGAAATVPETGREGSNQGPATDSGAPGGQPRSHDIGQIQPPPNQDSYNARAGGYYGPGGPSDGQCTSWVDHRRRELGLEAPRGGNGGQTAFRLSEQSQDPSLGAVGSYYNPGGDKWGHTFIVEKINSTSPPTIEISEMNVGAWVDPANAITTGWGKITTKTWTEISPGKWRDPSGNVRDITFGQ